eukprot:scaffold104576_cov59-Phaeocystis_antarctica.AAC.2
MSEEAGVEPASPAAAIVSRRESRSAIPERLKVAARDDRDHSSQLTGTARTTNGGSRRGSGRIR